MEGARAIIADAWAAKLPKRAFDWLEESGYANNPTYSRVWRWGGAIARRRRDGSILRWPENTHLFVLGILSFGAGTIGRTARRRLWRGWLRLHITGMAFSYILLLTAFYVDNGPHLPLWRSLPPLAHWLLPSLVGLPLLAFLLWSGR